MLAIDTNVLVRYLTGDHTEQSAKARALVDGNDVFIGDTVLLEAEWALCSVYGHSRLQVARALRAFAGLARVSEESPAIPARALDLVAEGMDFADALHVTRADHCATFATSIGSSSRWRAPPALARRESLTRLSAWALDNRRCLVFNKIVKFTVGVRRVNWSHGVFFWNELMAWDVERAKRFYGEVIGWTFESMQVPDGTYWIIKAGETTVGGMFQLAEPHHAGVPEGWMAYLAVDDIDARIEKAVAAGATVMRPAFDIPGVGRIAILKEPGGAGIGWITPAAR